MRRLFKRENSTSMIEGDQRLLENSLNDRLSPNSPNSRLIANLRSPRFHKNADRRSSSCSPNYLTPTADRKSVTFCQSNLNGHQEPNKEPL